jgi:phosphoribosylformylglycinamidine synthase subunit PurSL
MELAKKYNVQAVSLGEFTDQGQLEVAFGSETVATLDLKFLHDGLPPMNLKAVWSGPRKTPVSKESLRLPLPFETSPKQWLLRLARHPSLASKEKWIRQYDHEVQARTAVKPFEGIEPSAANDGGVIRVGKSSTSSQPGIAIGSGLAPHQNDIDPAWMAILSVDEAVRNVVVTGADPGRIALTDNFCWARPSTGAKEPRCRAKISRIG